MSNKKIIIISIFAIILVLGAGMGAYLFKKNKSSQQSDTSAITNIQQKQERVNQNITFDGTIAYDDDIKYYAESDSDYKVVSKVLVEKGDFVKKGQKLVEYDMDAYNDLLDDLKTAKLELATLETDLKNYTTNDKTEILSLDNNLLTNENTIKEYEATIKTNESSIVLKQNQLTVLENTLKQDKELYSKGYKSASDIQSSENTIKEYKDSIASLTKTNENLKRSINLQNSTKNLNEEKLKIQKNLSLDKTIAYNIKVKKLAIEKEKIIIASYDDQIKNFQRFSIATGDGVVTDVVASDNETVDVGTAVVTVANNKKLIINADVSEYEVNKIALGDKATFTGDGFEKSYTATVTKILPVGGTDDDSNVVVPIELTVDMNAVSETIRNSYTVSVEINKEPKGISILIPVSAIIKDSSGKSYVMILDSETNKPIKKEVKTGEIKDTDVEVFGISSTDKIVSVHRGTGNKNWSGNGSGGLLGGVAGTGGPPPGGGGPR